MKFLRTCDVISVNRMKMRRFKRRTISEVALAEMQLRKRKL